VYALTRASRRSVLTSMPKLTCRRSPRFCLVWPREKRSPDAPARRASRKDGRGDGQLRQAVSAFGAQVPAVLVRVIAQDVYI